MTQTNYLFLSMNRKRPYQQKLIRANKIISMLLYSKNERLSNMKKSELYRNAIDSVIIKYSTILQDRGCLEAADFETLEELFNNYGIEKRSEERVNENIF